MEGRDASGRMDELGVGRGAGAAAMASSISRLHVLLLLSNPAASAQAHTACHRSTQKPTSPHLFLLFAAIIETYVPARTLR
jgi:hypothetical protein